jgi:L-rhamnose mutarotase
MRRMGMMIGIRPERLPEYRRLHANVWPEILERLRASHMRNYSIFLREPENVMFAYWEYHGTDFEADSAAIAADPKTKEWWAICGPMQVPLETRATGEWWASMEEVFHLD